MTELCQPYQKRHDGDAAAQLAMRCDICIVTFNSEETISALLTSIVREPLPTHIHLFDNASSDGTLRVVRHTASALGLDIDVVESTDNLGFPAASNKLLRRCNSPIVALVNPDIEFTDQSLYRLCENVATDDSIGIAACRQMTRDNRPQPEAARSSLRLRRLLAADLPGWLRAPMRRRRLESGGPLYVDQDVQCMSGALMVFRRTLLSTIGYLDISVFMYLEDSDFAARVRAAGLRIWYVGTVWVWHNSGVSARGRESSLYALLPEVWLTYLHRYGRRYERLVARPVLIIVCSIAVGRRLRRGEAPTGEMRALKQSITFKPIKRPYW